MNTATADRTAASLAIVQQIYEAFGRGEVDEIVDDCRWEAWAEHSAQRAGVPYLQPRSGPSGAAAFFADVADLQIHSFTVLDCIAGADQVAVEIAIDATPPHADDGARLGSAVPGALIRT
jgi:hypothetical protein